MKQATNHQMRLAFLHKILPGPQRSFVPEDDVPINVGTDANVAQLRAIVTAAEPSAACSSVRSRSHQAPGGSKSREAQQRGHGGR